MNTHVACFSKSLQTSSNDKILVHQLATSTWSLTLGFGSSSICSFGFLLNVVLPKRNWFYRQFFQDKWHLKITVKLITCINGKGKAADDPELFCIYFAKINDCNKRLHVTLCNCRCYAAAAYSLLPSHIALILHVVTSWLMTMLLAIPSESLKWHTMTSWSNSVESSSSLTQVSNAPTSRVVNVKSIIDVVYLRVDWLAFYGLLFKIRWGVYTSLSSLTAFLLSSQGIFQSRLWSLKSPRSTTLPSMMFFWFVSAYTVLLVLLPILSYTRSALRWLSHMLTLIVLLFYLLTLSSSSHIFRVWMYGRLNLSVLVFTISLFLVVTAFPVVTRCSFNSPSISHCIS